MSNMMKKNTILSNAIWKFAESGLSQLITFVVSMILARILSPEDYGLVALMTIFLTLANIFVTSGIPVALIQVKKADDEEFSSVFFFNIVFSISLYIILFLFAPTIASFYREPSLEIMLRIAGVNIIIASFSSVQYAYISRNMLFKINFVSSFIATIVSAIIGIGMALSGFGVWSLVFQQLSNSVVSAIVLLYGTKWKPKLFFSWNSVKQLLKYGWKILFEGVAETFTNQLSNMIVGKAYTATDLGYFTKGQQFPQIIINNFCSSVSSVLLPAISSQQEDLDLAKIVLRKSVQTIYFLIFPLLVGMGLVARPLIDLILTEKWAGCVPYLQIYCLIYLFQALMVPRHQALNGIGRSDVYMYENMIAKIIRIVILIMIYRVSVIAIAIGTTVSTIILTVIVMYTSKRYNNYSYKEQVLDICPPLVATICMAIPVFLVGKLQLPDLYTLILQVVCGGGIYILISAIFRIDGYVVIWNFLKERIFKR